MLAYFQRGSILCFENRAVKHDTYTKITIRLVFSSSERSSPHATVFNFSRENKCFERAKVNSRCPTSFRQEPINRLLLPTAMLISLREQQLDKTV